jgi:hypothetical protein
MPWKNPRRVETRRTVSQRLKMYIASLMRQFVTTPDELLRRAEEKLLQSQSPPALPEAPAR